MDGITGNTKPKNYVLQIKCSKETFDLFKDLFRDFEKKHYERVCYEDFLRYLLAIYKEKTRQFSVKFV
jgi:hypothetical protein